MSLSALQDYIEEGITHRLFQSFFQSGTDATPPTPPTHPPPTPPTPQPPPILSLLPPILQHVGLQAESEEVEARQEHADQLDPDRADSEKDAMQLRGRESRILNGVMHLEAKVTCFLHDAMLLQVVVLPCLWPGKGQAGGGGGGLWT